MDTKKQIIQPFSKKVPILYTMIFFIPIAICWLWCVCIKLFSFEETLIVFLQTAVLLECGAVIAVIIGFYFFNSKKLLAFDGTVEMAEKLNKQATVFELGTVFLALLNALIVPCIANDISSEMTEISSHTENITEATSAGIEGANGNKMNMIDIQKEVSVFKL